MSEQLLVSVLLPSFNQGQYIAETLDSILSQDYPHFECVIVDGDSTDETLDIIQKYAAHDQRIVWVSEPDNGLSHALNKAHRLARGEIITWQNTDDLFIGQVITPTVQWMQQHPEIDLVYGDVSITDEFNRPTGIILEAKPFDIIEQLSGYVPIPTQGTFWRKSVWEQVGGFAEELHYSMDIEFFIRAAEVANMAFLPGVRATYRHHPHSKSVHQDLKTIQTRMQIAEKFFVEHPELESKRRLLESNFAFLLAEYYTKNADKPAARTHARRAVMKSPLLRRRWLYLLFYWVDLSFGTSFSHMLSHAWRWVKREH